MSGIRDQGPKEPRVQGSMRDVVVELRLGYLAAKSNTPY